ncbi:putative WPP domain-containing protein [Helianthus annuus]|nr:putative WPP domain-containing protein [Helianthus annuus]
MHSVKLWPLSHSMRRILVEQIVKNLTTPSILSQKYGLLSKEEAEEDAKQIEYAAFVAATQHFRKEPERNGGSAAQVYARKSSELMVEFVKAGPKHKEDRETIPDLTILVDANGLSILLELLESRNLNHQRYSCVALCKLAEKASSLSPVDAGPPSPTSQVFPYVSESPNKKCKMLFIYLLSQVCVSLAARVGLGHATNNYLK